MIDDTGLVPSPTWVGEPDRFALLVCKWLGVGNLAALGIKIRDVKRASGNLSLESLLKFETDFGLVD